MDAIKEFVAEYSEILTIASIVIGIFGVVLAIIFYIKSKKKKELKYFTRSFNLVHESLSEVPKLEIKYNKNEVKSLTITRIAFWNSGSETVEGTDSVKLDPVRIGISEEGLIYSIEIESKTADSNNFNLVPFGENEFQLTFDYIDKSEGCSVKIFHSGSIKNELYVNGKIKGGELNYQSPNDDFIKTTNRIDKLLGKIIGTQLVLLTMRTSWLIYLIATFILIFAAFFKSDWKIGVIAVITAFASIAMYPRKSVPKEVKDLFNKN